MHGTIDTFAMLQKLQAAHHDALFFNQDSKAQNQCLISFIKTALDQVHIDPTSLLKILCSCHQASNTNEKELIETYLEGWQDGLNRVISQCFSLDNPTNNELVTEALVYLFGSIFVNTVMKRETKNVMKFHWTNRWLAALDEFKAATQKANV